LVRHKRLRCNSDIEQVEKLLTARQNFVTSVDVSERPNSSHEPKIIPHQRDTVTLFLTLYRAAHDDSGSPSLGQVACSFVPSGRGTLSPGIVATQCKQFCTKTLTSFAIVVHVKYSLIAPSFASYALCPVLCAAKDETSVEFMGRMFCGNFLRKS
jgi:hypothetical protein